MIPTRKFTQGDPTIVQRFMEMSASSGIDLIELLMIPRNKGPYDDIFEIQGYDYPVQRIGGNMFDEEGSVFDWIDGTLKFYPDEHKMCYGYVFDTPENREKIATSLSTGWYRIVDKKKCDEIIAYAIERGYRTEPYAIQQVTIRKTKREKEAEIRQQSLEKQLFDAQEKLKKLEQQAKEASDNKQKEVSKRKLRGEKPIEDPNSDNFDPKSILETEGR